MMLKLKDWRGEKVGFIRNNNNLGKAKQVSVQAHTRRWPTRKSGPHHRDWGEFTKPHERRIYSYELEAMNVPETDKEIVRQGLVRLTKTQAVEGIKKIMKDNPYGPINEKQKKTLQDFISRIGG